MSDELETYLRAGLGRAAERAPKAPPRFPTEVVSRSVRRRTTRNALVAGVCVMALGVPAGLMATGGTQRGDVATGVITPVVVPEDHTRDEYRIGDVLVVGNPSQERPLSLWYARTDEGVVLCERVQHRTGGVSARCGRRPLGDEEATEQGSTESFPAPATGQVMYFGTARDRVARVTARTDAGEVTGTVHRPGKAPQGIWTVTVPADEPVTAFEFAGSDGETVTRIERHPTVVPEATAEPLGPAVEMRDELVVDRYETPDPALIWKLDGRAVGMHRLPPGGKGLAGPPADMDGRPLDVELRDHGEHWFGITRAGTARVALVFEDGTTVEAETRPNPWKIGGLRLFAGTQRHSEDIYRDGFLLIGYDANGAELWRDEH